MCVLVGSEEYVLGVELFKRFGGLVGNFIMLVCKVVGKYIKLFVSFFLKNVLCCFSGEVKYLVFY